MRLRLKRFRKDRQGSVAILTAFAGTTLMVCAGIGVDTASAFSESRRLQGIADLAAIAAASDLSRASEVTRAVLDANPGGASLRASVVAGVYAADPTLSAERRFNPGAPSPNAARVEVKGEAPLIFAQFITGKPTLTITRRATAARSELAAFSLGSRLASLQGGMANTLLSQLTGSEVNLSVMDYDQLIKAKFDLLSYVEALRLQGKLEGVSYDKVLAAKITPGEALAPLADVLDQDGQKAAATSLRLIVKATKSKTPIDLSKLIALGDYGVQDHVVGASDAAIKVSAFEAAMAVLGLAQTGRQLALDLGATVPGLTEVKAKLAIGERANHSPWLAINSDGSATVRTAQTRLAVDARLLNITTVLGLKPVSVSAFAEAASAEAKLTETNCAAQRMTVSVKPAIGQIALARIDDMTNFKVAPKLEPVDLIDLPLVKASTFAKIEIGGGQWRNVSFTGSEINSAAPKTVATTDAMRATAASLAENTRIDVQILGLNLGLDGLASQLGGVVSGAAPQLDSVVNNLTGLLGVGLGEADVRPGGLRCRGSSLVS